MQAAPRRRPALRRRAVRRRRCPVAAAESGRRRPALDAARRRVPRGWRPSSPTATLEPAQRDAVAVARRPRGHPLAPDGLPARRDAAPRARPPRSHVVNGRSTSQYPCGQRPISQIPDPEVPVVTIDDLGILRDVVVDDEARTRRGDDHAHLLAAARPWTPSRLRIALEADRPGTRGRRVQLAPAWTTDWMSERGRAALLRVRHRAARSGVAPSRAGPVPLTLTPPRRRLPAVRLRRAPRSSRTSARRRARPCAGADDCREPFDEFKAL